MQRWTRLTLALVVLLAAAPAAAQTYTVTPVPKAQFFDNNGDPCNGCLLNAYAAGTSTRLDTYSDNTGTPNTNPVVLDAFGRASIYLAAASYKFVLTDSTGGTTYWTQDNVSATPPFFVDLDITGTAGEALSEGNVVYLSAGDGGRNAGQWYKADADNTYSSTTAGMVGMAPFDCTSGQTTCSIRLQGRATGLSGLVAGTQYYASATAGALTSSAPANARSIGFADSSTTLVLAPNQQQPAGNFSVGGNLTVGGTLGVTGAATLSSTLGVTGAVTGASFSGVGSALTSLNASNISSGTLADARHESLATVCRKVSTTDINNTTTETSVFSCTVPGGTFGTNNGVYMAMVGSLENDTTATRTTTVRIKYGGTTVFTASVVISSAFTERSVLLIDTWLYAQNATNVQTGQMRVNLGLNSASADGGDVVAATTLVGFVRSLAVNSASDQTFEVTVQNSNNDYFVRVDSARLIKLE